MEALPRDEGVGLTRDHEQQRKRAAVERALEAFRERRREPPMGAHVLRIDEDVAVVRVMYLTDHIPPDRAWFAVPATGPVRELAFEDVAALEPGPWR
jgi:hypothetical protein